MKVKKNQILSHLKKPVTVRMKQAAAIQTWKTEGFFITFTVVSKLCVSLQSVYRVFLVILYFLLNLFVSIYFIKSIWYFAVKS